MKTYNKDNLRTKDDFRGLMMSVLEPLIEHFTEEKAGIDLGVTATTYPQKTIRFEAFSRPLWGLVPFWAGGGHHKTFEEYYRQGFTAGTDPAGK